MGDQAFYATAAQVLPVLLLALAFEQRLYFERRKQKPATSLFLIAVLIAIGGGELVAVLALLEEHPSILARILVLIALTVGVQALIQPLFTGPAAAVGAWLPKRLVVPLKYAALLGVVAATVLGPVLGYTAVFSAALLGLVALFVTLSIAAEDVPAWRSWRRTPR